MRKTKKGKKLAGKRQVHVDEGQQQQKDQVPYGEQQPLDDEEEVPNSDDFNEMSSSSSSSAAAENSEQKESSIQQQGPNNEEQEQQQLLSIIEQEQQQLLPRNEQEKVSEVELELSYDDQQEQGQVDPDVEQELLPNNNDVIGMLTETSNSSSTQVKESQQKVAENDKQQQTSVMSASFEPEPQLNHLAGMRADHTSAFSAPTARYGSMFNQYGQVPSQQQLGYPGWGYPVSNPPQISYTAPTNPGYHHLNYYPPTQCPAPPPKDGIIFI